MNLIRNYFDILAGLFFAAFGLLLWYVSSVAIVDEVLPKHFDYAFNFVIALVGTFTGAASAFWFNAQREDRKKEQSRVGALRSALFTLIRQINTLMVVQKGILPKKNCEGRHLLRPAKLSSDHESKKLRIQDLEFLLEVEPNALMAFSVEQDRFETAISVVADRYDFHVFQVQPAMEKSGLLLGGEGVTGEQAFEALGERIWHTAISHADNVYKHVPETVDSLNQSLGELLELANKLYPNHSFLEYRVENKT